MNKNTVVAGLIVGGVAVAAGAAIVLNSGFNPFQQYATVVAVEPAFETNRVPRVACGEDAKLALAQTAPGPTTSTSESPETAATPEEAPPESDAEQGADAGPSAGDCVTVYATESIQAGYDVTYELDGVRQNVRMDRDPGERIPVENGRLVLSRS